MSESVQRRWQFILLRSCGSSVEYELGPEESPSDAIFPKSALKAFEMFKRKYAILTQVEPSFSRSMNLIRTGRVRRRVDPRFDIIVELSLAAMRLDPVPHIRAVWPPVNHA